MRVFTVHAGPPGSAAPTRLIPEGFSLSAFLFGPAWLVLHGAWPFAILATVALLTLPWVAWPGIGILIGLCGHDACRVGLKMRGWTMHGVVLGADREQAELRWFDRRPGGVEGLAP